VTDISTLGLGRMGSALAQAIIKAGHSVTVWNRSRQKIQALAELGAVAADSVSAAVAASSVILICIDGYKSTRELFEAPEVLRLLPEKTIVQLSTGTPKEARDAETWFLSHGAQYLDGVILGGPQAIGTRQVRLLYAGQKGVFDRCRTLLRSLGEDTRFVGENVGAPEAIDFAWLSKILGAFAGVAHGALICEAEGVGLEDFSTTFAEGDNARWMLDVIRKKAFSNPGATLRVWNVALRRVREQAREASINTEFPDFISDILDRAEAAGHGEEHIAAMVKVLRSRP